MRQRRALVAVVRKSSSAESWCRGGRCRAQRRFRGNDSLEQILGVAFELGDQRPRERPTRPQSRPRRLICRPAGALGDRCPSGSQPHPPCGGGRSTCPRSGLAQGAIARMWPSAGDVGTLAVLAPIGALVYGGFVAAFFGSAWLRRK
jgi:hypothetical protein